MHRDRAPRAPMDARAAPRRAHERARAGVASALRRSEEARKKSRAPPGDARRVRQARLAALRASVEAARNDATRRAAANASRAAALREASRLLQRRRAELFSLAGSFAEGRRALAMRARAAEDAFAREACFALADLKTLVPVAAERPDPETRRLCGVRKNREKRERTPRAFPRAFPEDDDTGVPTAVRVFGFRAVRPGTSPSSARRSSARRSARFSCSRRRLRTRSARRAPARGDGAGSDRARVWVPESYFEEAPPTRSPPDALPLYLPRDVVEANGGGDRAAAAAMRGGKGERRKRRRARVKGTMAGIAATGATAAAAALLARTSSPIVVAYAYAF